MKRDEEGDLSVVCCAVLCCGGGVFGGAALPPQPSPILFSLSGVWSPGYIDAHDEPPIMMGVCCCSSGLS